MSKIYTFLATVVTSFCVSAQSLYFPPTTGDTWETISPQSLNWCQNRIDSLYSYLDSNNTKAFILLKDGKIILERYFGSHTPSTPWQWASAGKTITTFLAGIAQQENLLSINDSTSKYLGQGWTSSTPAQEGRITIRHQLSMTSGLDDEVPDHFCILSACLIYKADAGTRWAYHNGPYTLLDSVLEKATGMTLNGFTTQKLKNPTGMTGAFFRVGYNNVFFSNARSMARFGLLILNRGNWNGTQIMTDTAYFDQMVNTSQSMNPAYGYLWWLNGKSTYMVPGSQFVFNGSLNPNAPADMVVAMGKDGQFLNVVPSQNLVWLRMGNSPDGLPVPFLMNDKIWELINDLECQPTGMTDPLNDNNLVRIYPNPATDIVNIKSNSPISKVEIYNFQGQLLYSISSRYREFSISISDFPDGLFFVKADLANGTSWTGKLIKETE